MTQNKNIISFYQDEGIQKKEIEKTTSNVCKLTAAPSMDIKNTY